MVLIRCPRCDGTTPHPDAGEWATCRWCGHPEPVTERNVIRHPERVRRAALADLRPVAAVMLTFGIGQLIVAGFYLLFFTAGVLSYLMGGEARGVLTAAVGLALLVSGLVILSGSVMLFRGRGRLMAVVGAWLMLTSPLLVGLPFGVWAVSKLVRREARAAFLPAR